MATHAERRAGTQAAVMKAARKLFGERGFAATSVDDIAAGSRVAKGAGRPVAEVNQLLEQFKGMQKMMKKAAGGGFPGMPGMGGGGGGPRFPRLGGR